MLWAITFLLGIIARITAIVRTAFTFIVCNVSRIYKPVAAITIRSGLRRIDMIRLIGVSVVALYAVIGSVEAGNKYSRKVNELDQSLIAKTITGTSEIQCILRSRRNDDSYKTFYEKEVNGGKSPCHFLKDGINPSNGNSQKKSGIIHEKIKEIGRPL